ncbi:hypothetical protein [Agrococcus sp. ProA11]|uniref:hypothetical protein n=1 Tax=Agrococcus chionoecetis TaxID=3153752 RepID=UPI0032613F58
MTISNPTATHLPRSTNRAGRWISIVVIVLGAIGIVFALGGGVVRGLAAHSATSGSYTAAADGIEQLQIDSSAAAFEIRFDDVEEATLQVVTNGGPVQQWSLQRSGDALIVDTDRRWGWLGLGGMFGERGGEELAVLTLPAALERAELDLETDVSAGSFTAAGEWGSASLGLSAGSAELSGTAASLTVEVSAGEARIDVATGGAVQLEVSAGRIVGSLTGEQPSSIDATVSAGAIELTIPDGAYAVTESVSAGDSDVRVTDDQSAASTIDVEVSAGNVRLIGGKH